MSSLVPFFFSVCTSTTFFLLFELLANFAKFVFYYKTTFFPFFCSILLRKRLRSDFLLFSSLSTSSNTNYIFLSLEDGEFKDADCKRGWWWCSLTSASKIKVGGKKSKKKKKVYWDVGGASFMPAQQQPQSKELKRGGGRIRRHLPPTV